MVVWQLGVNQSKHVQVREAFILLYTRGYKQQAERLYQRLLKEMDRQPTKVLLEDFQRTMTLVDTARSQPENLIWVYHWTVSNELERRSGLKEALKLAEEN